MPSIELPRTHTPDFPNVPYYPLEKARRRHSQFVLRISLLILAQFVAITFLIFRLTEKGCF